MEMAQRMMRRVVRGPFSRTLFMADRWWISVLRRDVVVTEPAVPVAETTCHVQILQTALVITNQLVALRRTEQQGETS